MNYSKMKSFQKIRVTQVEKHCLECHTDLGTSTYKLHFVLKNYSQDECSKRNLYFSFQAVVHNLMAAVDLLMEVARAADMVAHRDGLSQCRLDGRQAEVQEAADGQVSFSNNFFVDAFLLNSFRGQEYSKIYEFHRKFWIVSDILSVQKLL